MSDTPQPAASAPVPAPSRERRRPIDLILVGAAALVVGLLIGHFWGVRRERRRIMRQRVYSVGEVEASLNDQQEALLQLALDQGKTVVVEKIGNLVKVLAKAGEDRLTELFVAPRSADLPVEGPPPIPTTIS